MGILRRLPNLSVFEDGRETFGPGSDGLTTILHLSSLEVRLNMHFDRDSLINLVADPHSSGTHISRR